MFGRTLPRGSRMPNHSVVRRMGLIVVATFTAAMAAWTWRAWPDPVVDFGQQLYVSWRMAEGAVLYRDLAYHYGPLSPWLNALAFEWFGAGLMTVATLNLVILLGIVVLISRIFDTVGGPFGTTIAGCCSALASASPSWSSTATTTSLLPTSTV